ncbi:MAG: anion permease [Gammaproteobacteria bacterium]|nr:anion permease [Gammaproteobacteria bacterium]MBU1556259.1 anion permease [Gammaproteobacteria bacterium]MBU2071762.1 anion permease [Gammaproteobacteria bacterium]MBU2181508.1 anion permease [Gammaproteobacteria bacterium]MBU2203512.1 anion permease [Gammaproteobacteria bacterium]
MPAFRLVMSRVTEDYLLLALLLLLPLLLWLQPASPANLVALVDWHTVTALAGLMLLSRALEDSGYLARFAAWLLPRCHSERLLALLMLLFAALLSAIVTNDVALFILLPITLSIGRLTGLPVGQLIIFLALAVNAGSALTPIGNPQNLLLWQASGYSFWQFTSMMAPLALSLLLLILLLSSLVFGSGKLSITVPHNNSADNRRLFACSLAGYPLFILAMEYQLAPYAALVILALYLLLKRSVVTGIDWLLLLVFMLMFIDLGLLAQLPLLQQLAVQLIALPDGSYLGSAILSQLMSNVPAAIFLQHFTDDWRALSWGVTVGGFGLAIGSLANLIALRLSKQSGLWREFHYWSLPVFLCSLGLGVLIL